MDNATSLFQGTDIKINNSQNNDEEEDIEDQKRRKEELQHLLTAALDDFNYDESTVNSSANMSLDEIQQNYRQASDPNEQLKVLYDVRVRELDSLRLEYNDFKAQTNKDINVLNNKLLLSEADMRQLKISFKNMEDILVEKTSTIRELKDAVTNKDQQIKEYEKAIENYKIEICTYQTTVNELQLKLADSSPFSIGAKRFNSEELQKAHQEQIARLEHLLDEQTKVAKALEKENISLQQDLNNLITQKTFNENENNATINALTRTVDDAQQQCKNLLDIVEMLTNENHHLQERLDKNNMSNVGEDHQNETLDSNALLAHIERLKRLLVDKSIQINTLNTKLKSFENDTKDLMEYRQLKCDIYKREFQQCENKEHTKSLIVMQNDLQNYRRIIDDKNQQILTLNSTNRDLQEKIEEMLLQTRNEIQNLSHKYSLPQLEQMTDELKNAEERVKELQERLDVSEKKRLSLVQKLQKNEKKMDNDLKESNDQMVSIKNAETEKCNLETQITTLQKNLEIALSEVKNLKEFSDELMQENAKLKLDLRQAQKQLENITTASHQVRETDAIKNEYEELKQQLNQVMAHLQKSKTHKENPEIITNLERNMEEFLLSLNKTDDNILFQNRVDQWKKQLDVIKTMLGSEADQVVQAQLKETLQRLQESKNRIKALEDALEDMANAKTMAEGEKCTYQFQVGDFENQLEHADKTIKYLRAEVEGLTNKLSEREETVNRLHQNDIKSELDNLRGEFAHKENVLRICEENKNELNDLLHKTTLQLEETKKEVLTLQSKLTDVKDKAVRRNLEKELKEAENHLEQSRIEEGNDFEDDHFKKCLQAEILKSELKLREDLQLEYLKKMRDIEKKYKKAFSTSNELYEEQLEKMKKQEVRYREHLAKILSECAQKINEFENEKQRLISQIKYIQVEYTELKNHNLVSEENYKQLIKQIQTDAEKKVDEWKNWSKQFVSNCLKIETINKKSRDNVLAGMKNVNSEIALIEKAYKEKVKKYLKSEKS